MTASQPPDLTSSLSSFPLGAHSGHKRFAPIEADRSPPRSIGDSEQPPTVSMQRHSVLNPLKRPAAGIVAAVARWNSVAAASAPDVISILSSTLDGGVGREGGLAWHIPEDLKYFKKITVTPSRPGGINGVIMGRKTWDSIPSKYRPLPDRLNVVVSRSAPPEGEQKGTGEFWVPSMAEGLRLLREKGADRLCIAGGASIYDQVHESALPDKVYWTQVVGRKVQTDAVVQPRLLWDNYDVTSMSKSQAFKDYSYQFLTLERKRSKGLLHGEGTGGSGISQSFAQPVDFPYPIFGNFLTEASSAFPTVLPRKLAAFPLLETAGHEELQYLSILEEILETGVPFDDRTGVGTLAKFGVTMRYDLRETFPLLTTKRVYWKGVVEELLWFLKGHTNAKLLAEKDVHIWDANGSREFLDSSGLSHREIGDLGPVYGFQWRHFGAAYKTWRDDYRGKGYDQVQAVIDTIKKDPASRRLIISAWNPAALHEMALPPCHMMVQFFADPTKQELSCLMYQRSADWGLGVPFNIASYALMCHIVAHLTGYKPREFVHVVGNAHVYKNHIEPLREQVKRPPRPFPQLRIQPSVHDIDELQGHHFKLVGYQPWPTIKMDMAV